ncbi:hypothetical protein PtrSN002B_006141 [Pyrenophora tritici-repentis]|nr:hypothetical protein PtrSN001A_005953 [Pyrenophora tritici-repentis]KAI1549761.1 hypothetical protein PtrSN002B_006141 [Pyrenophora tritici-repentis]
MSLPPHPTLKIFTMQIVSLSNVVSSALRVPDMHGTAVKSSVNDNKAKSLYERLHRPYNSRSRLSPATPAVAKKAVRSLATTTSRSPPGAVGKAASRKPLIAARARADYPNNVDAAFRQTRIPGPTIKARVRTHSSFWERMTSIIIRRPISTPTTEITEETTEVETKSEDGIIGWEEFSEEDEEGTMAHEADDTSVMFGEDSLNEALSPSLQTDAMRLCERTMISMKRLRMNMKRLINAPWFDGLARCPSYTSDNIGMPRVRPRKVEVPEEVPVVVLDEKEDAPAAATSDMPKAASPAVSIRKPAPVPTVKVTTVKVAGRGKTATAASSATKRQARKPDAASKSTKALKPAVPKTSSRKAPAKVAPPRPKAPTKPQPSKTKTVSAPTLKGGKSTTTKAIVICPASVVRGKLKSALRQPGSKTTQKRIQFLDGPIKPCFYSHDEPANQSLVDAKASETEFDWEPLQGFRRPPSSSQDQGTRELFEFNDLDKFTLKRRFLQRYVSVRAYEARRRQDMLSSGEPGLGQLEYGNGTFKVALQVSGKIVSHDIGIVKDLSEIGSAGKFWGALRQKAIPVVVFGSFYELYEPTIIPDKRVKAFKKPARWPTARFWDKFIRKNFGRLPAADLED